MKNSRLFQIIYLLMERGELTAGELAGKLEVSVRTIYRDLDALSAAGIPVYAVKGQGGGIRLMEQYQMDRSLISEQDQEQILTALQSLKAVGVQKDDDVLTQLSGLFRKKPADWLEVEFSSWGSGQKERDYFELCKTAIWQSRLLRFGYYNSSGVRSMRRVEPCKLVFRGGNWYLSGYCRYRADFRFFRLSRMDQLIMEEEQFPARSGDDHERRQSEIVDAGAAACEPVPLLLYFTERAGFQVMDYFAPEEILRQPDGCFLVKATFPMGPWVLGFLLSFGAEVKVLGPSWVAQELKQEAERIRKQYE